MSENVGGIEYDIRFNTGELINGSREVSKQLDKTGKDLDFLGGKVKELARSMAGLFAAGALVAQLKQASDAARLFEKNLSNLSALTGATGQDLVFFGDAAKELGLKYGKSASDIVGAMKLIGSTKPELLENKEALKQVTDQVLTLAKAATIEAPDAASALTSALNQFGEGANKAGEFINIMAAGAQQGTAEIVQVNESLKNAGATANAVGISFAETNAAIQGLAKGAIMGAEAGTALRTILLKMDTDTNVKLRPSVNGLTSALDYLAKQNYSNAELTKKFGLENVNAALTLIAQKDVVDKLSKSIVGTSSAYDQAKTNSDNFQGSVDKLKASFDQMQISIGEKLNPSLRVFADALTAALTGKVEAGSALEKVLLGLEVAALSLGAVVASRLIVALTAWGTATAAAMSKTLLATPAIGGMSAALGMQAAAATRSSIATNALTATMGGLRVAMSFLGGPLGVIALAGVALYEFDKSIQKKKADDYADAIGRVEKAFRSLNAAARSATLAEINLQMDALIAKQKAQDAEVKKKGNQRGGVLGLSNGEVTATVDAGKTAAQIEALAGQKANLLKVNQELLDQEKKSEEAKKDPKKNAIASSTDDKSAESAARRLKQEQERAYQELLRLRVEASDGLLKIDMQEAEELDKLSKLKFEKASQYEEAVTLVKQKAMDARFELQVQGIEREQKLEEEAAAQRTKAQEFAKGVIGEAESPEMRAIAEWQNKVDKIEELRQLDLENQALYDQALLAAEETASMELRKLWQDQQDAKLASDLAILSGGEKFFGASADMVKTFAGEQSGAYKAMFAVSRAFAIAQATMNLSTAVSNAMAAAPFPANLPAMFAMGAQGASLVSAISGVNFGGGRRYGGAVDAGSMYRVNESGMPEMFTANNGAQYMMPTSSGSVTPANEVGGGGGVTINISNYTGADVKATASPDGKMIEIAVTKAVQAVGDGFRTNTGPAWDGLKSGSNVQSKL